MTVAQGLTAIIVFWAIIGGLGASMLLPALQGCVERRIRQPALLPPGAWAVPDLP